MSSSFLNRLLTRQPAWALGIVLSAALVGCGGGSDPIVPPPSDTGDDATDASTIDADLGDAGREDADEDTVEDTTTDPIEDTEDGTTDGTTDGGDDGGGDGGTDGGTDGGDDGGTDAGPIDPEEPTFECGELPPVTEGRCSVEGLGLALRIRGTVLGPDGTYVGGEVIVDGSGFIECAGCDCADAPSYNNATVITCPGSAISPGLINTHDHITFTQMRPGDWGEERFDHRNDWRNGSRGHSRIDRDSTNDERQISWGEMRQVLIGTTTMVGSGEAEGFVRNADRQESDLGVGNIDYDTFPIGTSSDFRTNDCGYDTVPFDSVLDNGCYHAHVAEGVDGAARNEFLCVSSDERGGNDVTEANAAFVHLVGLVATDAAELALSGTSAIWSPRSNVALYGDTAPVTLFANSGVNIAISTDWTASGSMNLARELTCAAYLDDVHYGDYFSDRDLWEMATQNGADALKIDGVVGRLEAGLFADVAIYAVDEGQDPYRAILEATPDDTILVMASGLPLYGDADLMAEVPQGQAGCESMGDVCGVEKTICAQRETGNDFATLQGANTSAYDLFFCGEPAGEPTCVPSRPGEYTGAITDDDTDGDGIANGDDNCPTVFNPIRPVDDGAQADTDQDGLGDVCDRCPLAEGEADCGDFDPNDRDGDGVPNREDVCPELADDQLDSDTDGIGDACDPCPDYSDASGACQFSIYDIKQGTVALGSNVVVEGVVTAVGGRQMWIQVADGDRDATLGARFSGIYAFTGGAPEASVGDYVQVSGATQEFFGQIQLSSLTATNVLERAATATPVAVEVDDVAEGADAEAYEGVLVTVSGQISGTDAPAGPGDSDPSGEYLMEDALRIGDLLYTIEPALSSGDEIEVTGAMRFGNSFFKLEPRSADDVVVLVGRPPRLDGFGPAEVFAPANTADATLTPGPLTITLDRPAPEGGTTVDVAVSRDDLLTAPASVTIEEGETELELTLSTGEGSDSPVTVTVSLDERELSASVTIIREGRLPAPASTEPASLTLVAGQTAALAVSLDIPALAPTSGTVTFDGVSATAGALNFAAGERTASVDITAGGATGDGDIVVAVNGEELRVSLEIVDTPPVGLVLSEVLYDLPGSDDGLEWIEIYNGTASPIDLSGYTIGYGGRTYTNETAALSGTIPAFGCFVVGGPDSTADNGNPVYDLALNFDADIQNSGSTADAIGLFDGPASDTTPPVDSVVYGSSNDDGFLNSAGEVSAVDVGDADAGTSLERTVDGWIEQPAPTPGVCAIGG